MDPTLTPARGLRRLSSSFSNEDINGGSPLLAGQAPLRTAAAQQAIPIRSVPIGSGLTRILPSNPARSAAVLRGNLSTLVIYYGGSQFPPSVDGAGNYSGLCALGQESVTLETTDEIWAYSLTAGQVSGVELVSNTAQP